MDKQNQVVLISGAGGALGQKSAMAFAKAGASLVLVDASAERLAGFPAQLASVDGRLFSRAVNLTDARAVASLIEEVLRRFERIDVWLHLVGGWNAGKPVHEVDEGSIQDMLSQHLWTTFRVAKGVIPVMRKQKSGRIIFVSSPRATQPEADTGPFAVGKAAQEALALTMARENADSGITVNILHVDTIDVGQARGVADPRARNWTRPEEIVTALLFLSSDDARMINGARIPLYGG